MYIILFIIALFSLENCSTLPRIQQVVDNEWMTLKDVGYQIKDQKVQWTVTGNVKSPEITEVILIDLHSFEKPTQLFHYKGKIKTGLSVIEGDSLKGKELDWLKDTSATRMNVEVQIKNLKGEAKSFFTPISFSSASKETTRKVLKSIDPNWDK